MNFNLFICIFGSIFLLSIAQKLTPLKYCKDVKTVNPFDLKRYLGDWYEIVKFPVTFEEGQKCVTANYQLKVDGHVRVDNKGYYQNSVRPLEQLHISGGETFRDGKLEEAVGDAFVPDASEPARLKVKFNELAPYGDYWVLDTDYDTYTMVYSCTNVGIGKLEFAWILSRQRTLSQDKKSELYTEISKYEVDTNNFVAEDQSNCPE